MRGSWEGSAVSAGIRKAHPYAMIPLVILVLLFAGRKRLEPVMITGRKATESARKSAGMTQSRQTARAFALNSIRTPMTNAAYARTILYHLAIKDFRVPIWMD